MSFFLGSKKEISDKSRDREDSKKVKESDSLSSLPDKVFSDDLNSPELAKLLERSLLLSMKRQSNLKLNSLSHLNLCQQSLQSWKANQEKKKMKRLIS